ncbi:hypothetical protein J6590_055406 [Homalodisca vitripennis]|nr:hypothetical protein J6590_055406 [Homalodisca vitripennis]
MVLVLSCQRNVVREIEVADLQGTSGRDLAVVHFPYMPRSLHSVQSSAAGGAVSNLGPGARQMSGPGISEHTCRGRRAEHLAPFQICAPAATGQTRTPEPVYSDSRYVTE